MAADSSTDTKGNGCMKAGELYNSSTKGRQDYHHMAADPSANTEGNGCMKAGDA